MKQKTIILAIVMATLLSGCSPLLRGPGDRLDYIQQASDKYLRSIYLKGSSWSIMAVDLESGRIILNRDSDRMLIPASNMKLLTTACALETLGPDYRIPTLVGYRGEVDSSGVLHGDLEVIGFGDPTVSTRYTGVYSDAREMSPQDRFTAWADSVISRGIYQIEGNLVGYDDLSISRTLGADWAWNDLKYWYAAEISPFIYTDGCLEITVTPGDSVGDVASVSWDPDIDIVDIYDEVLTVAADAEPELHFDRALENNIVTVWGSIPLGSEPEKLWVAVYNAQNYFMAALREALEDKGILISGSAIPAHKAWTDDAQFNPLFTHNSPPLSSIIRIINRDSQNLYAEMLLRILGSEMIRQGDPSVSGDNDSFVAGRNKVRSWESTMVGFSRGFAMIDGSGLSRRNLISASGLIKVLVHMNRSPYRSQFIHSLATPGQGTLRYRFLGLPQGIRLYAKSGTMNRVRSLSGYISTTEEPRIAFSMICNNYLCDSSEIEATMENLCQLLALYLKES